MKIEHNSQSLLYRSPFGAVTKGTEVTLRLALSDFGIPKRICAIVEFGGKTELVNMAYSFSTTGVYLYEAKITAPDSCGLLWYHFEIESGDKCYYYGNNAENSGGLGKIYLEPCENKFQITVYDKSFKTPSWWRNSVCYQIFPDRFYNGNEDGSFLGERTDIIKRDWGDTPFYKSEQFGGRYLANDFFGGNLLGIEKKLPYLKELGISSIYLNPIFKAFSNHKYDTGDYKTIDPMFGTQEDFVRLSKAAKKLGIRIILDGVFNHTGSNSLYFNKNGEYNSVGAYQSQSSPYYDWFRFDDFPDKYESWWGIDTLPQIEESSKSYQEYILTDKDAVIKKWLKLGASGWRLDVVDEIPDFFVKILREQVKAEDSENVIIGEVWEDASNKVAYGEQRQYFYGDELDSVMNYPLRNALISYITGNLSACGFDSKIMSLKENYPRPAFYATLNFLSSHDTERILTVMSGKVAQSKAEQALHTLSDDEKAFAKSRLKCLISMQMLLPGVPTIFYGDEAGMLGFRDPFCRACYPWGNEDTEIYEHYKKFIKLRSAHSAFTDGEFESVYKYENGYAFSRYDDDESFVVLINPDQFKTFRLDIAKFGAKSIKEEFTGEEKSASDGIFYVDMPERSVKIFKISK